MKRFLSLKKYVLVTLLSVAVAACSSSGDSGSSAEEAGANPEAREDGIPDVGDVQLTEVTNFAKCQGTTPKDLTITTGMWYREFEGSDGIKRKFIYEFDDDTMFVAALCDGDGIRVRAPVGADAIIIQPTPENPVSTIEIIEDDAWTVTGTGITGRTISCTTDIPAMPVKKYSFQGPCLKFESEDGHVELFAATR